MDISSLGIGPLEKSFGMNFTNMDDLIDFIELKISEIGDIQDRRVLERMSPMLYTREAHANANDLIVSLKHKTEHQFIISKGSCAVFTDGEGWVFMEAPFHGLTKVGTRRLIYVFEDLIFTTIHPVPEGTNIDDVKSLVIEERTNTMLNNINETICLGQQ